MGFNTRVVAFFYDKAEYKEEIRILRDTATYSAMRYNLRMGIVTDRKLVMQMKNSQLLKTFFATGTNTQMILKRYDGELFSVNLPEIDPKHFLWWITDKTMKPVEQLSTGVFQITEAT